MPSRRQSSFWFWAGSVLILLDVGQFIVILLRRWEVLSTYVVCLLSVGVFGLLLFWYCAFVGHKQISRLAKAGSSEESRALPTVNEALSISTTMAIRGLFVCGLSVSFFLRAVFKLSHPG
jgi:hypothetical protein